MTFDVTTVPFGTSLARQVARQHLTQFNNVFWVGERSYDHLHASHAAIKFPSAGPGVHGVFATAKEWDVAVGQFRVWCRQQVLVSAASLLEAYFRSAATAAYLAKPGLLDRSLTRFDGVAFLKDTTKAPEYWPRLLKDSAEQAVKGEWKQRFRAMTLTFGRLPDELQALEIQLQKLQTKRNNITHEFGGERPHRRVPWEAMRPIAVSDSDVVSAIELVSTCISEADERLFKGLIGGHDMLLEYHDWQSKQKDLAYLKGSGTLAKKFRSHIGKVYGPLGSAYVKGMIKYYERL